MARQFTRHEDGLSNIIYAEYINELQEALEEDDIRINEMADRAHTHEQSEVQGLIPRLTNIEAILESKVEVGHKHSASDLTSGIIGINFLPVGTGEGTIAAGDHNHDDMYVKFDALVPLNAHVVNKSNPHGVTKAQVGLGSVDNTSDAAKPISTATQTALNAKANSSHTHSAADINSGTLAAARIPNLDASKTTAGTFHLDRIPNLPTSRITSGVFADARIPSLNASKVTAGTFATARIPTLTSSHIPNLNASKITAGTFSTARIPQMSLSQLFPNNKTSKSGTSAVRNGPSNNHGVLKTLGTGWGLHDTGWRETTDETWAYVMIPQLGFCWIPANRI